MLCCGLSSSGADQELRGKLESSPLMLQISKNQRINQKKKTQNKIHIYGEIQRAE